MSVSANTLWKELINAGVATGEAPSLETLSSPWYVRVLLGFSGWLAALFLLIFIGAAMSFVIKSTAASAVAGFILIGIAFAILRSTNGDFVEQLALATSIAGQGLVVYAIFRGTGWSGSGAWWLIALLHTALALVMPNFLHRAISAFFAAFSIHYALAYAGAPYLFSGLLMIPVAIIWLNEFSYPKYRQPMRAIGYGLVIGLVNIKGSALFHASFWWMRNREKDTWAQPWMDEVLAGGAILYVVYQLLRRNGVDTSSRTAIAAFAAAGIAFVASLEANGITVGVLVVLLGFAGGNRVLLGLGIASLLFYVSSYYYMTDTTLLVKSYTLLATGLVLLGLRWAMRYVAPTGETGNA